MATPSAVSMPDPVAAQVRGLGAIACVFAHPDDEAYLAGGLMAAARMLGQPVRCITATSGEAGGPGPGRRRELAKALTALGVDDHHVLDLPDGGCAAVDATEAMTQIAARLVDFAPDTIVTFDDDGHTGHPDHVAVGRWTVEVAERCLPEARVLRTAVSAAASALEPDGLDHDAVFASPDLPRLVDDADLAVELWLQGELLDRKMAGLAAHRSQTASLRDEVGPTAFRHWVSVESFTAHPADHPVPRLAAGPICTPLPDGHPARRPTVRT
ncbi:MAG: PIG-L deacetylase family protein [Acidimicrobiales bacterium]